MRWLGGAVKGGSEKEACSTGGAVQEGLMLSPQS